jgi:3-deoxy-D-manno-octulosonic acid kinase
MHPTEKRFDNQYIIFDDSLVDDLNSEDFDIDTYRRQGRILGETPGRGSTYFVEQNNLQCVLRHYRRGGFFAGLTRDRYWWSGLYQTRSWREWYLLGRLRERELPVPRAVGARVVRHGLFYRADLLMEKIPDSEPLSRILGGRTLDDALWRKVGATLRRFHQRGVFHADLNAHNILLTVEGDVFVVDFDKGELRATQRSWQLKNLQRLRRSLDKLKTQNHALHFADSEWDKLLAGYTQL